MSEKNPMIQQTWILVVLALLIGGVVGYVISGALVSKETATGEAGGGLKAGVPWECSAYPACALECHQKYSDDEEFADCINDCWFDYGQFCKMYS